MKQYVGVIAQHEPDGKIMPIEMIWTDGRRYEIERIYDVRRAASLKSGGVGNRYACRIRSREVYLYDEDGRWFVEDNENG